MTVSGERGMFEAIEKAASTASSTLAAHEAIQTQARERRYTKAYQDGAALYGSILLPTIFPGTKWKRSDGSYAMLDCSTSEGWEGPNTHSLFDHPLSFRKLGTRGPTTWINTVVFGQPYGLPSGSDVPAVIEWLAGKCVTIWWRKDLSMWYPGWTVLVLAARGLKTKCAADFGFEETAP